MAPVPAIRRPVTAEELAARGSRDERAELWDGVLWVRQPSGGYGDLVSSTVLALLFAHVRRHGLGWVSGSEMGFLLARGPDRVLCPDAAFVSARRRLAPPARGFAPFAPDFVLETKSPDDDWLGVVRKCGVWNAHGVPVVWAMHPVRREVAVFRAGEEPVVRTGRAFVDAGPALPRFRPRVDRLFCQLDPPGPLSGPLAPPPWEPPRSGRRRPSGR
jgi:Uma2 family endonuclease